MLSNPEYSISEAITFCQGNVEVVDKIVYLPIYMLMFLKNNEEQDIEYKFDLTGLK